MASLLKVCLIDRGEQPCKKKKIRERVRVAKANPTLPSSSGALVRLRRRGAPQWSFFSPPMVRVESEILPCRGPILNHKQHAVVRSLAPEQKSAVWKWSRASPPYCTKSVKKDGRQSARVGTRCVRSVRDRHLLAEFH